MPATCDDGAPHLPRAVSAKRAGELLGLSERTVRTYIARGLLGSVRIGRRVLVPEHAIHDLLVVKPKESA